MPKFHLGLTDAQEETAALLCACRAKVVAEGNPQVFQNFIDYPNHPKRFQKLRTCVHPDRMGGVNGYEGYYRAISSYKTYGFMAREAINTLLSEGLYQARLLAMAEAHKAKFDADFKKKAKENADLEAEHERKREQAREEYKQIYPLRSHPADRKIGAEEDRRKAEAEAAERGRAQIEAEERRKAQTEAEERRRAQDEAEARRKAQTEAEARVKAQKEEEERRKQREEEIRKREAQVFEARRKAEEEKAEAAANRNAASQPASSGAPDSVSTPAVSSPVSSGTTIYKLMHRRR